MSLDELLTDLTVAGIEGTGPRGAAWPGVSPPHAYPW
jgi:hypothetical protein